MRAVVRFFCLSLFAISNLAIAAGNKAPGKTTVPTKTAGEQLMYLATWPHTIHVIDVSQSKIVDNIELPTDIARLLVLSPDKTKLFALTLRDNAIVTVDLKTHKVLDSFSMNTDVETNRLSGLTVDPNGTTVYSIMTTITKKLDHYEIADPKFVAIDLVQKKVIRSGEFPKDDSPGTRAQMHISPDGKFLYIIRNQISVFSTSDFKLVKKIELADAAAPPGMDNLSLGVIDDPNAPPGKLESIFNASDPYVHRRIFGIAEIDLATLEVDEMTPVGPEVTSIQPLRLTPDRKLGYTAAVFGAQGDRTTQFWVIDMATKKIIDKKDFIGRTRFSFDITADGKKLLIYNAGFQIEVYDAKTLSMEKIIDLGGDTTSNLIVAPTSR